MYVKVCYFIRKNSQFQIKQQILDYRSTNSPFYRLDSSSKTDIPNFYPKHEILSLNKIMVSERLKTYNIKSC